jgi:hypothetical protein
VWCVWASAVSLWLQEQQSKTVDSVQRVLPELNDRMERLEGKLEALLQCMGSNGTSTASSTGIGFAGMVPQNERAPSRMSNSTQRLPNHRRTGESAAAVSTVPPGYITLASFGSEGALR